MKKWPACFLVILLYVSTANIWAEGEISIKGRLLMLDDETPHVAVPIEMVRDGEKISTILSDNNGEYQVTDLTPGKYQLRCQVLGGYVYYGNAEVATEESDATLLQIKSGKTLENIDLRFAAFKKGTWRNYTHYDGLPDNVIIAIYRDLDGAMWFGTFGGGVSRYDGKEFVNFTTKDGLASNTVSCICRDKDGFMWFGTGYTVSPGNGISRYDGEKFVNFTTADGLASNTVNAVHCDSDGTLWVGTGYIPIRPGPGGISRYDGDKFIHIPLQDDPGRNMITTIYQDPDDILWFGVYGDSGGLVRYDGKTFRKFTDADGFTPNHVRSIHGSPDGVLWIGRTRYDGKDFVNFTVDDGLTSGSASTVRVDSHGNVWSGTGYVFTYEGGGVSRYDGKTFVNFTTQDGLAHNTVTAIYSDPDGVMWFGTERGLSRYDSKTFANFTTRDGLANNSVVSFHSESDGVLWFGTEGGVSRYEGGKFTSFAMGDGLVGNNFWSISHDIDGVLWFGARNGGVSRYDGKTFENFGPADGLPGEVITSHTNPDGTMWFATNSGLYHYDGERFEIPEAIVNELGSANKFVISIHRDPDDVLWFGTQANGIFRGDGEGYENITVDQGLAGNTVWSFHRDSVDALWIATVNGVSCYKGEGFTNFTVEDGLAHNSTRSVYSDESCHIWFGAYNTGGVSQYDGFVWTSLDTRDGLAGDAVRAIHQDSNGDMWFATAGGVTRYRPSATRSRVYIASVEVERQLYTDLAAIPSVTVGDDITIRYSAIDFKTIPEKQQYRYQIMGLDPEWRRPTKETEFEWTPDEPGTYTFEVQAIDRDLNYSQTASLSLSISAISFYRTGIFLVGLSIASIIFLFMTVSLAVQRRRAYRGQKAAEQAQAEAERIQSAKMVSLRQLIAGVAHQMNNPIGAFASNNDISSRAIEKIKERIAECDPHEIEEDSQLTKAFAILDRMNEVNQDASQEIARTVGDLRSFVRLDEAEWQLADIHEAMDTVLDLMQSEFSNRIKITRDYGDISEVYCSPSSLNQVFMSMFKNACEAIEGEGEMHLRTSVRESSVIVEISDTGTGISPEDIDKIFDPGFTTKGVKVGVGLGLSICYQIIVDEHNGRIDVSGEAGEGTTFTITLPQQHH